MTGHQGPLETSVPLLVLLVPLSFPPRCLPHLSNIQVEPAQALAMTP